MAVRVTGLLLAFVSHIVLSRSLGAHQYGYYVIALGWAMVLVIPSRLGLDTSVLRFATVYRQERQDADFRGLVIFSLGLIGTLSLLIAGSMVVMRLSGLGPLQTIELPLIVGMSMLIPSLAVLGWISSLLRTANHIFASQFYDQALRPTLLIGAVGVMVLVGQELTANLAMMLTGLTIGIATVAIAVHARISFGTVPVVSPSFEHRREWMSVSWVLFLMAAVQELLNQVDLILLGVFGDATQAAHFAAAWRLSSLVPFGLVAIATVSAPLVASAYNRGDLSEIARIARLGSRLSTLFAIVIVVGLAAAGKWALGLFGPGFEAANPALLIMLAGGLVNSFTGTVGYLLIMTGRQQSAFWILLASLLLSIVVNVMLIPRYGAVGSSIASTLALSAWNLGMAFHVRRQIGLDATALGRSPKPPSK